MSGPSHGGTTPVPPYRRSCSALILAGGHARRFGSDKLEVVVEGSSVLEHVLRVVRTLTDDITIVGRDHPGTRSVLDPEPRQGPLAALAFALADSNENEAVLVVAGDHPILAPSLLAMLVDSLGPHDAVVPVDHRDQRQPLVAVYRRSLVGAMRASVTAERLGLIRFLESADVDWVEPSRWESFDPDGLSFVDVDTTDDLESVMNQIREGPRHEGSG